MDSAVFWGNCCNNCYNCYNNCNCDCNCNCKCNCYLCDDSEERVPGSKKPSISNLKVFIGMNNDLLPINRVIKEGKYSPVKLTFDITNLKYVQPNSLTLLKPNGDYVYDLPVESPLLLNNDVFNYKYDFPYKWKLWISDLNGDRYSTEFLFQKGQTNVLFTLKARPDTSDIFFDGVQQITKKEDGWVIATREYPVDSEVKWSVQKRDYITQTGTVVLDEDKEVIVDLIEDKLELILDIRPKNAKVWINDELYTYDTHVTDKDYFWYRMDMPRDTNIVWKVEAHDYIPQRGEFVLSQNTVLNVYLDPIIKKYYLTFNVNPADAIVTVNGEQYTDTQLFEEGTFIEWEVSAEGYETQSSSFFINEDTIKNINLVLTEVQPRTLLYVRSKEFRYNNEEEAEITIDDFDTVRGTFGKFVYEDQIVHITVKKDGYYPRSFLYKCYSHNETLLLDLVKIDEEDLVLQDFDILKLQYINAPECTTDDLDTFVSIVPLNYGEKPILNLADRAGFNLVYKSSDSGRYNLETTVLNHRALNGLYDTQDIIYYNIYCAYRTSSKNLANLKLHSYKDGLIYKKFTTAFPKTNMIQTQNEDGSFTIDNKKYYIGKYIHTLDYLSGSYLFIRINDDLSIPSSYNNSFQIELVAPNSDFITNGEGLALKEDPNNLLTVINESVNIFEYDTSKQNNINEHFNKEIIVDLKYKVYSNTDRYIEPKIVYGLYEQSNSLDHYPSSIPERLYDYEIVGFENDQTNEFQFKAETISRIKGHLPTFSIIYSIKTKTTKILFYDDFKIHGTA